MKEHSRRDKTAFSGREKNFIARIQLLSILLFGAILFIGFLLGMLWFLRPATSEAEKRELTPFPELTAASFWDGSFFSDLSIWYADTFPFRDSLIRVEQKLRSGFGVTPDTMLVGGNQQGDDIPTIPPSPEPGGSQQPVPPDPGGASSSVQVSASGSESSSGSGSSSSGAGTQPVAPPDGMGMNDAIQQQIQKGLYLKNGAAYSIYYFRQEECQRYVQALNDAARKLDGISHVYSILVPNNSGAMLSEEELNGLGGSNQQQAISYYYSLYDEGVTPIRTIETLREHNDEYLYFRTDHHWTQLGAYYVYRNFCEAKHITPHTLDQFETLTVTPFLGTFYDTLVNPDMEANPDTVTAYIPMGTNTMTYWDEEGVEHPWKVISDVRNWNRSSGYYCYIGGDRPLSIIENPQIQDGSSCMVLKESYGNCFIPFLVDHYQTVYVVDFRYAQVNVVDYIKEHGIQDFIVINNITIAATSGVADRIASLF